MEHLLKIRESMKNYSMLNSLAPKHANKHYPYNPWSDVKVEFTMKQIELFQDKSGVFYMDKIKKGGKKSEIIIF